MVHVPGCDDKALVGSVVRLAQVAVLVARIGHARHQREEIEINEVIPIEVLAHQTDIRRIGFGVPRGIHEVLQRFPYLHRIFIGVFHLPGVPGAVAFFRLGAVGCQEASVAKGLTFIDDAPDHTVLDLLAAHQLAVHAVGEAVQPAVAAFCPHLNVCAENAMPSA